MKKTKKKNKAKARLSALILLLLLTVVMLATSTYAWFTANKTVQVDDITVNVTTSTGLQISTDALNWKTVIANSDITAPAGYETNTNQFPQTLTAVSTAGDVDTDGKLNMYLGTVGTTAGDFTLTATKDTEIKGTTGHFVAFDVFLKSEAGGQVYLSKNSSVKIVGTTDAGLQNAARTAFVNEGTVATSATTAAMQALKSSTAAVTIWEPNYDAHTANGVNNAKSFYNAITGVSALTAGTGNAQLKYDGISAPISTGIKLADANSTAHSEAFKAVTTLPTLTTPTTGQGVFSLAAGVTKFRVYLWVEGQDVDCENNASGYSITYNMVFSLDNA
jgi:hypothetical protein